MFVIQTQKKDVFFQNDTKDVIDILCNYTDEEVLHRIFYWLNHAGFGDKIKTSHISIICIHDTEARSLAKYYGVLPEYEKVYGKKGA